MSFENLSGKVVLVTGGSAGIGSATCQLLASRGATVAAVSRRNSRAQVFRGVWEHDSILWMEADLRSPEG